MWKWIVENRQWLFSGAGISVLAVACWIFKRLLGSKDKADLSAVPISNSVTQAPTFNISLFTDLSHSEGPQSQSFTKTSNVRTEVNGVSAKPNQDIGPKLYSLPPRICFVSENHTGRGTGLTEGGDYSKAVVAAFRMQQPASDGQDTYITARLSFITTDEIAGREISKEFLRINHGTWLDEDFNFVEMTLTDTKELVIVLEANGKYLAVQDNRHSVMKENGLLPRLVEPHTDSFFVDVTLVDSKHGVLIVYTYKIEPNPLAVHEVIRVPRPNF
jgi:hypothetical protein